MYGLFQIFADVHPEFDRSRLTEPGYNVSAAFTLYSSSGFSPWTGTWPDIARALIPTVQALVASGGTGQPPATGGLPGLPNPEPQPTPAAELPGIGPAPIVTPPPDTTTHEYPHDPAAPDYSLTAWEAVQRYFSNDLPYYTGYDQYIVQLLDKLPGSAG